jgi:hypothetical protein
VILSNSHSPFRNEGGIIISASLGLSQEWKITYETVHRMQHFTLPEILTTLLPQLSNSTNTCLVPSVSPVSRVSNRQWVLIWSIHLSLYPISVSVTLQRIC